MFVVADRVLPCRMGRCEELGGLHWSFISALGSWPACWPTARELLGQTQTVAALARPSSPKLAKSHFIAIGGQDVGHAAQCQHSF